MPTLILSSRYTQESKILRTAAQALQWETFRAEDGRIPSRYKCSSDGHAIYCTVPQAFQFAERLGAMLLGCSSAWLPSLPEAFTRRRIWALDLKEAVHIQERCFMKPALGKSFDAAIRTGHELAAEVTHLPSSLKVHVSEVVAWEAEYRCFIKDKKVITLAPYRRGAVIFSSYESPLGGPQRETYAAADFAESVVNAIPSPRAFVLDVGLIPGRGWAVVEPNECWGSGLYGCALAKVLEVLLAATVDRDKAADEDGRWDYARHYYDACPHMIPGATER